MSQAHDEKLKKSFVSEGLDKTNMRVEQLYFKNTVKEETLERKRQAKANEAKKECTFQPNLTKTQKFNSSHVNRTNKSSYTVVDRLYEDLSTKYDMLEDVKQQRQLKKTQEEMNQCTFYPQINDLGKKELENLHDSYPMPRSYKDAVNRLKRAKEMRMEKQRKLEEIPIGSNLEKLRRLQPNPPRCYRGNLVMKFQINISDKE